jgi:hypothetical protein
MNNTALLRIELLLLAKTVAVLDRRAVQSRKLSVLCKNHTRLFSNSLEVGGDDVSTTPKKLFLTQCFFVEKKKNTNSSFFLSFFGNCRTTEKTEHSSEKT